MIFGSSSSALLNGVPRKVFHCKRGVRQSDPLSPFLLVLVADFVQTIINAAKQKGVLSLLVNLPLGQVFQVLQYVDDTFIFMQSDVRQLFLLEAILNSFAESTSCLKVNYANSMMVTTNVNELWLNILANIFGNSIGSLPFTYLGLPLSLTKPTVVDFWPLVTNHESQLVIEYFFILEPNW